MLSRIDLRTGFLRQPVKRSRGRRRGPQRSRKYLAWVRTLPCIVGGCCVSGQAAHTGRDGGMSMKASDFSAVPICPRHHLPGFAGSYHELGREGFEDAYEIDLDRTAEALFAVWLRL